MAVGRGAPSSLLPQLLLLLLATFFIQARIQRPCYSPLLRRFFQEGESWTEPTRTESTCRRVRCSRGRAQLYECEPLIETGPPSNCRRRPGKEDAPFPACCPSLECDQPNDDRPCFDPRLNRYVAPGEKFAMDGRCQTDVCTEGGRRAGKGLPCPPLGIGRGCTRTVNGDDSLEFPLCCPRVICDKCYSEELERFFSFRETWTEAGCVKKQCKVRIPV